jgi:putative ABC transport system ATP-binding protein
VLELLCELAHEQNRAVVIVTHDSRVIDLGDRLVHLEDGRISSVERLNNRLAAMPQARADSQSTFSRS